MKDIIPVIDVNSWTQISVLVFFAIFVGISCFVYLPSRHRFYKKCGRIPLDDE